jgi:hypothetical protein
MTQREKNVSPRKQKVVESASFDTIIEAILTKSEKAQCTFMHRLLASIDGEVLATTYKYAEKEIKGRSLATTS